MLVEEETEGAIGKMKQFATQFTHGIPGGAALRKAIYAAKQPDIILASVDTFFSEPDEPHSEWNEVPELTTANACAD
jgi:hypothetical protein